MGQDRGKATSFSLALFFPLPREPMLVAKDEALSKFVLDKVSVSTLICEEILLESLINNNLLNKLEK